MRDFRMLAMGVLALLVLGATTAGAASARQVDLFEPGTDTQVSATQKLGTVVDFDLEGGRVECRLTFAGELERWLPLLEPPARKTTIYYAGAARSAECSSDVAGETIVPGGGGLVKIKFTAPTKATVTGSERLHEYQPGGLYCSYESPYVLHLTSQSDADRAEWADTGVFKRARIESDDACPTTLPGDITIGVGGEEDWDGEALETKLVS